MKTETVKVFIADDGSKHFTETECLNHNKKIKQNEKKRKLKEKEIQKQKDEWAKRNAASDYIRLNAESLDDIKIMCNKIQPKIICVDFDDTVIKQPTDSKYPDVGSTIELAVIDMAQDGILKAVKWYQDQGIELYGINGRPEHDTTTEEAIRMRASTSPKVRANLYIDDAACGCPLINEKGFRPYVDWKQVCSLLINKNYLSEKLYFNKEIFLDVR